jgi:hypothetical protein
MIDDPTGGGRLLAWMAALRQLSRSATSQASVDAAMASMVNHHQRLLCPGVRPVEGPGLVSAATVAPVVTPGRAPRVLALLQWMNANSEYGQSLDDLVGEDAMIAALLTYVSDRLCEVPPEITASFEDRPGTVMFLPFTGADTTLGAPMPPWEQVDSDLRDTLGRLAAMKPADAEAISAALHMHYSACLLAVSDLSGAYATVVGGLEALASHFGSPPSDWSSWSEAGSWDKFFTKLKLTDGQCVALRGRLLRDKHLQLTETFANYVCDRLPIGFWEEPVSTYAWSLAAGSNEFSEGTWSDPQPRSADFSGNPLALKTALKSSYAVRSRYLHSGRRAHTTSHEFFGDRPGRARSRLSLAQLRSALRAIIQTELAAVELDMEVATLTINPATIGEDRTVSEI